MIVSNERENRMKSVYRVLGGLDRLGLNCSVVQVCGYYLGEGEWITFKVTKII